MLHLLCKLYKKKEGMKKCVKNHLNVAEQEGFTGKGVQFHTQDHPLQQRPFMYSEAMKYFSSFSHHYSHQGIKTFVWYIHRLGCHVALSSLTRAKIWVAKKIVKMLDICNQRDFLSGCWATNSCTQEHIWGNITLPLWNTPLWINNSSKTK